MSQERGGKTRGRAKAAPSSSPPVVGIGASAGGLEALQQLLPRVPADLGAAFVVVQHLDPTHPTLMAELLSRQTAMTVKAAEDGLRVEPDHVYIIPPNAVLTIERGSLRIAAPAPLPHLRTPIDSFFRSLAEEEGENAVCIVLSGSGTDGTLGLRAVKGQGGMAMAQEPSSAKHDSMPKSAIATGLVDYVLPAGEMAARLAEYLSRRNGLEDDAIRNQLPEELPRVFALLRRRTGHDFSAYKQATIVRRIERRIQVRRITSIARYRELLEADPKELDQLLRDLLIGVTQFFRDPQAFEILARDVVAPIFERATTEGVVRIWTPGCATGEETYSIAILLREEMLRRSVRPQVQIFAGDIDEDAVEVARQGRYVEGIAAHVTPERLARFFERNGHFYLLKKEIRDLCVFSTHSVIKDPPFSRLDLIACRNLLIYLEPEMQKQVLQIFHYALVPDGYLFLGSSENAVGPPELFRTLDKKHKLFRKNQTIAPLPTPFPVSDPRPPDRLPGQRPLTPAEAKQAARRGPDPQPDPVPILERILVEHYSPAWVVVNALGETVYFSPRTGRYLEPAAGAPSTSLVNMARRGLRIDLRTAIHEAVKSGATVVREDLTVESDGEVQKINLIVRPLTELSDHHGFFMIVFQEIAPPRSEEQARKAGLAAGPVDPRTLQLESELRQTKEHLQATIEQLESSNEELTSSNEELLSTNEELQSTNEELQTSKEELQSVNEELETINAELTSKLAELADAQSDVQNLLLSTQIAAVFLDAELRIKRFTPPATALFRLIDTDVGRPIADVTTTLAEQDVLQDFRNVLRTLSTEQRLVRLADGSGLYMMRVLPYRRVSNVIDGIVATFVDVTELTRAQSQQSRLAAIVESSQDAIVGASLDGTITSWNDAATALFGIPAREALGSGMSRIGDPQGKLAEAIERAKRGEAPGGYESTRSTEDRGELVVSTAVSPVKDRHGRVIGISASFHDLTELARAKEELQDEGRRKDEFLAMLSHELRNPLAPLRTCLEVMESATVTAAQTGRAREMMKRQVDHLTTLVDQLLDLSRISSGKIEIHRERLDLAALVRDAAEDYRGLLAARGVALGIEMSPDPLWISGDATRLSQAVGNLLHNAQKFTDQGSVDVTLTIVEGGDLATISVRDTGQGIEPQLIGRLFQPFAQSSWAGDRSRSGLGLGLAVAKGLVESHGGSVSGKSAGPGQGAEFTIRLPLDASETRRAEESDRRSVSPPRPRRRILIVEDNEDAAESLRVMLELEGHEVLAVSDGRSALAAARAFDPDAVVCDIGLPGGMDGYALASAFRADPALRRKRLVALTGFGRIEDQRRAREAGFDLHLRKPVRPEELRRWLAKPTPRSDA